MYRAHILGTWDTWGDDDVLLRAEYTRRHRAIATNYLHVLSIGPDALEAICSADPCFYRHMRRRLPAGLKCSFPLSNDTAVRPPGSS